MPASGLLSSWATPLTSRADGAQLLGLVEPILELALACPVAGEHDDALRLALLVEQRLERGLGRPDATVGVLDLELHVAPRLAADRIRDRLLELAAALVDGEGSETGALGEQDLLGASREVEGGGVGEDDRASRVEVDHGARVGLDERPVPVLALLHHAEQSGVLDGDRQLVRHRLHHEAFLVAEAPELVAFYVEDAHDLAGDLDRDRRSPLACPGTSGRSPSPRTRRRSPGPYRAGTRDR